MSLSMLMGVGYIPMGPAILSILKLTSFPSLVLYEDLPQGHAREEPHWVCQCADALDEVHRLLGAEPLGSVSPLRFASVMIHAINWMN